jgi:hypothetical protein
MDKLLRPAIDILIADVLLDIGGELLVLGRRDPLAQVALLGLQ